MSEKLLTNCRCMLPPPSEDTYSYQITAESDAPVGESTSWRIISEITYALPMPAGVVEENGCLWLEEPAYNANAPLAQEFMGLQRTRQGMRLSSGQVLEQRNAFREIYPGLPDELLDKTIEFVLSGSSTHV